MPKLVDQLFFGLSVVQWHSYKLHLKFSLFLTENTSYLLLRSTG